MVLDAFPILLEIAEQQSFIVGSMILVDEAAPLNRGSVIPPVHPPSASDSAGTCWALSCRSAAKKKVERRRHPHLHTPETGSRFD